MWLRRSMHLQSMCRSALVRCVSIIWTGICYIQVAVRQHVILSTDVCVRIQMESIVLYPCGDYDVIGYEARYLAFQHGSIS